MTRLSSKNAHTALVKSVLAWLSHFHSNDIYCWGNNTGAAVTETRFIRYGFPGSADILGVMRGGRMLCVEAKTGKAVLSKNQREFRANVERLGGLYIVVHEDYDKHLKAVLKEVL